MLVNLADQALPRPLLQIFHYNKPLEPAHPNPSWGWNGTNSLRHMTYAMLIGLMELPHCASHRYWCKTRMAHVLCWLWLMDLRCARDQTHSRPSSKRCSQGRRYLLDY